MIKQRAIEISQSPVMANVTYNDIPGYIQRVSDETDTARIFPLVDPEDEKEVNLSNLIEH